MTDNPFKHRQVDKNIKKFKQEQNTKERRYRQKYKLDIGKRRQKNTTQSKKEKEKQNNKTTITASMTTSFF